MLDQYAFLRFFSIFERDARGAIAIIFAFSLLIMMMAAGAAIDFGMAYSSKSRLQSAIDSAALAAAKLGKEATAKLKSQGLAVFKSNYPDHASVNFDLQVVNDAVKVTAQHNNNTSVLRVIGINSLKVNANVEVPLMKTGKAEVVLVLDYSDSMVTADKYIRMRDDRQDHGQRQEHQCQIRHRSVRRNGEC